MRVRIEGASSPFPVEKLQAGVTRLREAGFVVDDSHAGPRGRHAFLNGTDEERRASLQEALDSDVDVVWLARGGYGLGRIVDDLAVRPRGPRVIGFSDATALFARFARAGALDRCVHGPLATTIAAEPADSFARTIAVLRGETPPLPPLRVLSPGVGEAREVTGPLFCGNLCVLASLCGTPSQPRFAGAIVALEEVGERPYRLDRMLTQLLRSGVLQGVAAVVLGQLTGCDEPLSPSSSRDPAPTPAQVFVDVLAPLGVPVVAGLAAGHETPNLALPLGGRASLSMSAGAAALSFSRTPARAGAAM